MPAQKESSHCVRTKIALLLRQHKNRVFNVSEQKYSFYLVSTKVVFIVSEQKLSFYRVSTKIEFYIVRTKIEFLLCQHKNGILSCQ